MAAKELFDIKKHGKEKPAKESLGRLVLTLKDEKGQPITARTTIIVREDAPPGRGTYRASSRAGEVTRFVFEIAARTYRVEVRAEGYKEHSQYVTVPAGRERAYEILLALRDVSEIEEEEEERDAELLKGRFTHFIARRVDPAKQFPSDARNRALAQKRRMRDLTAGPTAPPGPVVTPGCNWLSIGPRNINGRVRAMAMHPTKGGVVYAGAASGGVWVSEDAGQSWRPLTESEDVLEIGALATHLTDPALPMGHATLYAGTGEPTWWPGYAGIGVLKSTDSGATWNPTGALPAPGNDRFAAILIDPTSVTVSPTTTVVYAGGTPGGLYKSTNGGTTWTQILAKPINGLAMDPTNPNTIYAAVSNEGIFQSTNGGGSFAPFNTGLTSFPLLILIDIGKTAPHKMYAKLDETVYVYDTGTASWTSLGNHGSTTYGYWNNLLGVDPSNSDVVFAGGFLIERTPDGGATWLTVGGLHVDQHALVFDPVTPLTVYAGNDGGVYRGVYTSPTDTGTWAKVSDGLIITQFNDVGASLSGPDVIGGGTQDNGTNRTVGGLTWDPIFGADGGYFVVDPAEPRICYVETQYGSIYKSTDGGTTFAFAGSGFPGGPWVTPIVLDPTSPPEPGRILFAGSNNQVYRTTDSAGSWAVSSPMLGGAVNSIAIAPTTSAVVYAGNSAGEVWRNSDNGATLANWKNITVGALAGTDTLPPRQVTDIGVDPIDPDVVYVTFSGFDSLTPATPGHVFRGTSTDGWTTWSWEDISSNLPDTPVNAIEVDRFTAGVLYVGTDVGVFRSTDGGLSWLDFEPGLPNVVIADLGLSPAGDVLRAATYGRGMFEIRVSGTCSDVDVYVRDNKLDTGKTIPSPSGVLDPTRSGPVYVYWWESADIKVDAHPYFPVDALFDGVEFDLATAEDVVRNDAGHPNPNRLYVQVHNRGPLPAHNVKVKALYADASAGLPVLPADFWSSFPNDWTAASAWNTVDSAVPFQTIPQLDAHTPKVLQWNWVVPVSAADHTCMLVVVSADEDPVMRSDANPSDHLVWVVVPNDKHVTLRNLHVITLPSPPGGGVPVVVTEIDFHNPFRYPQLFELAVDRRELPRGARLSLLLPTAQIQAVPGLDRRGGTEIGQVSGKEWWWEAAKRLRKRSWRHWLQVEGGVDDLALCRKPPHLPGVLIPGGQRLRAAVVVSPPAGAKPGSSFRFTVLQRQGGTLLGGSTYEIQIQPAEVVVR